jgi:hypothetical protein
MDGVHVTIQLGCKENKHVVVNNVHVEVMNEKKRFENV